MSIIISVLVAHMGGPGIVLSVLAAVSVIVGIIEYLTGVH